LIEARIGHLHVLRVPATGADMPQPDDLRHRITPEKKRPGQTAVLRPDPEQQRPAGVRRCPGLGACSPIGAVRQQKKRPTPGDGLPIVRNPERAFLHFTLNQYTQKTASGRHVESMR